VKRMIAGAAGLAVIASALWFVFARPDGLSASGLEIETAQITRRNLSRVVTSSGPIAPLVTVEVGSQLSGLIQNVTADFNDPVEAGQLLARIDPQTFATRVREAEAALEVARAQVNVSEANVIRADAELNAARRAFERAQALLERGNFSEAAFDNAQTAYEGARSGLAVSQANLRNARATLEQREAALESARVDLERTYIRSPINGVVIDRQIDEGQTVAASLNAPILFLIAQDLSRIQIEAQVDESDIGQISVGQPVTFDVSAFPDRSFEGAVSQVRLAATAAQNVVTYTVVIQADNPGQRLLPGMTANVTIVTGSVTDALAAPNAALRFTPRGAAEALVVETPAAQGSRPGSGGQGRGGAGMIDRLAEQLDMTEEQKEAAERAMADAFSQMRTRAQSGGGGGGGVVMQMADGQVRQAPAGATITTPTGTFTAGGGGAMMQALVRRALADILTSEQMARYDALQTQTRSSGRQEFRRGQVWVQRPDGRIEARTVGIGLSDGQFSQITGDGFQEGDRVVIRTREAR
jgi:HlyD family secretion protein